MKRTILAVTATVMLASCGNGDPEPIDRTKTVVQGINYVGLTVSDLERAKTFYALADLKHVEDQAIESNPVLDKLAGRSGIRAATSLLRSVNGQLRLMQFAEKSAEASAYHPTPVNGPGIAHVCYQAVKETGLYHSFLEHGATHIGSRDMVELSAKNPVKYAYATDHDGILFEVEHVDVERLNLPTPPKNKYRLRHVALATADIDRLVDFYSEFLEEPEPRRFGFWKFGISGEAADKVSGYKDTEIKMAWFQVRNMELEIGEYLNPAPTTSDATKPLDALGYNMIVFDVTDIDAAKAKLLDSGGTIVTEPSLLDGGQIIFGRDPDGNLIGLQKAPSNTHVSSQNFKGNGT